ncbi:DUF4181 domain-containing protein [Planococcus sp. APC 3906]|uniref:DUF4181 domain-containing protein n=1 Tax=Planococcus sp. APC 3906 TaxID=3035194 RepID=UPI0025B60057|nr:DUF4181 domain-containing protein [Planococcus sp. APC 3906]MDN3449405.1 DUF4181 domain-containing protein [Planococcus sp. APC 3906]
MNTSTIVAVIAVLALYFLASQFILKKKLKIKADTGSIFHQDRKKLFIAIDGGLLLLFVIGMMVLFVENDISNFPGIVAIIPLFALPFLLGVNHAIEQWLLHRPEKAYWHEILSAAVMLVLFAVIWAGEK